MWPKLMSSSSSSSKSTFTKFSTAGATMAAGRPLHRSQSSFSVDEEYNNALRTNSYVDMYAKVHHQLKRTTSTTSVITSGGANSSPLSFQYHHSLLPGFLLEPIQESLLSAARNDTTARLHALFLDFFDTTRQACTACTALLTSIDRARSHHRAIRRLLLTLSSAPLCSSSSTIFSELSSLLDLDNPLSPQNLSHFHLIHALFGPLVRRLSAAHRKIARRMKLIRVAKKASGLAIIALFGGAAVALAVIATHAAVAVAAVPLAMATGGWRGIGRWVKGWVRLGRGKARLDAAAKGAYIVGRDLDTMSRMVRRVHDEVEHGRDVGRMVVRNREWGMVREVVREMEGKGGEVGLGLEEQLQELEEHVYLCLITINRSRRLVAQELMQEESN